MDQYIGKLLDNRYEILECIGTGGMAVVYKARCHRLNRLVAVKILKPELASDAEFRRRFHDESRAVAMLSHPNIVAVYDVSHSDDLNYIVMELIDGITLKQYMQKRGVPLNWREALHFITQIMKALGHAHSRGIIHRDIKPHNIMVLRDGSVKVADFGIARLTSAAQSTLTQEALGSVHYISPEQAKGSYIDGRSDIYSAGVVLYEMTTGRLPFEGDTPVSVAIQHINSIPISPRELNPEIPEALEAITMKAMAPDPDQRYASADEMLEDLEEFRKNPNINFDYSLPELAEQKIVDEPTQVLPASHIRAAGVDDSLRRYATAGGGGKAVPIDDEEEEPEGKPAKKKRTVSPVALAIIAISVFLIGIVYFVYSFYLSDLFTASQTYTVPDLTGMTMEEIQKDTTITDHFTVVEGTAVSSSEYAAGQVVSQLPDAKTEVKEGNTTITVNLSSGADKIYMPDVTNYDQRKAIAMLQDDLGMNVETTYAYDDKVTSGYVVSFTPEKGTELKKGDTVSIVVSQGPEVEKATVPNFVGETVERAKEQLNILGLVADVYETYDDQYPAGQVIFQSVPNGTEVEVGSTVKLQVSKGPEAKPSDPGTTAGVTKQIWVDLSDYVGVVQVKIVVGDTVIYDNAVDASEGTISQPATATGSQQVAVYIDDTLVSSSVVDFTE